MLIKNKLPKTNENNLYISHFYLIIPLILIVLNLSDVSNVLKFIVTNIQFLIVFYYIFKNKIKTAYIIHNLFILSSISFLNSEDSFEEINMIINYSKLKMIGPISFSYIITFIIYIKSFIYLRYKTKRIINSFLYSFIFLIICGVVIGMIGLMYYNYSIKYFIYYLTYNYNILINILILINVNDRLFINNLSSMILSLLIATPIASILLNYLGIKSDYGGIEKVPINDIFVYTPIIIFTLFNSKPKLITIVAIISYIFVLYKSGEGKSILFFFICIAYVIIYIYRYSKRKLKYIYTILSITISILLFINMIRFLENSKSLSSYKFEQIISLTNSSNIENMADSPRIRYISTLNILNDYKLNPLSSIFGYGYGGYFEDNLSLFGQIELKQGSFSDDQILSGKYFRPHDTLPTILLTNGISGLIIITFWSVYFILKSRTSLFFLGGIPWLFLAYGFNQHIALLGLLLVYIGFYNKNNCNEKIIVY